MLWPKFGLACLAGASTRSTLVPQAPTVIRLRGCALRVLSQPSTSLSSPSDHLWPIYGGLEVPISCDYRPIWDIDHLRRKVNRKEVPGVELRRDVLERVRYGLLRTLL